MTRPVYKIKRELPIETTTDKATLVKLVCEEMKIPVTEVRTDYTSRGHAEARKVISYVMMRCMIPSGAVAEILGYKDPSSCINNAKEIRLIVTSDIDTGHDNLKESVLSILKRIPTKQPL